MFDTIPGKIYIVAIPMEVVFVKCKISMFWDDEACVWVATSDDMPGLVLEDGSFEGLVNEVKLALPTLVELNGLSYSFVDLEFVTQRLERLALVG